MSYYKNQIPVNEESWMESVLSQMSGKPRPIVEQAQAAPSKTVTDFIGVVNGMSQMFTKNKNMMPADPKEMQAFTASMANLGKLIPALQNEMKAAAQAQQKAQAAAPAQAAPAQGQPAQAGQPAAPAAGQPAQAAQAAPAQKPA